MLDITSTKIDTSIKIDIVEKKEEETGIIVGQTGQIDSSIRIAQEKCVSQVIVID